MLNYLSQYSVHPQGFNQKNVVDNGLYKKALLLQYAQVYPRLSKPRNPFCSDPIISIAYDFLGKKYRNKQAYYSPFILPVN